MNRDQIMQGLAFAMTQQNVIKTGGGIISVPAYIESDGNQYVDLGYVPKTNSKFLLTASIASTNGTWASPFGVMNGNTVNECILYVRNNGASWVFGCWGTTRIAEVNTSFSDFNIPLTFWMSQDYCGYMYASAIPEYAAFVGTAPASFSQYGLYLFGCNDRGTSLPGQLCRMKFYGLQIYEGTTLVKNYLPAIDSNGTACVYEALSGAYLYNAGSGNFTVPT